MSTAETLERPVEPLEDRPRPIDRSVSGADKAFHGISRSIATFVLVLTGSIGLFLLWQAVPTFQAYGFGFLTTQEWNPQTNQVGILAVVVGTFMVAMVAMVVAFPLAYFTAIFISEYAPARIKSALIAMIDLMAAVPSIIYGLWGFFLLQPGAIHVGRWLATYLAFIPFFGVDTDPQAASWAQSRFIGSAFVAGLVVAMMVIPLACAVMVGVFGMAPVGEREAALALGSTRWGMIRAVVLPFGRGGVIGGTMLGLGRALGETIAVLIIISPAFEIKPSVIQVGTNTVSALIAGRFGEATADQLSALMAAGLVLFLITLVTNTIAGWFVARSRSGSATEI